MRIVALLSFILVCSISLKAQLAPVEDAGSVRSAAAVEDKVSAEKNAINFHSGGPVLLQNVNIYPNPVPQSSAILHIQPIGLTIYSYQIVTSTGSIVEIENLIGRDEFDIVLLRRVDIGLYYITFTTSAGTITKTFSVI